MCPTGGVYVESIRLDSFADNLGRGTECPGPRTAGGVPIRFRPGAGGRGMTRVLPETIYSETAGFGFEPGGAITGVDRGGDDPVTGDFCTAQEPFFFSVAVPEEGNYRVTVTLGDRQAESVTTIKAELRRLMVEKVRTAPGEFAKVSFIVNTRTPEDRAGRRHQGGRGAAQSAARDDAGGVGVGQSADAGVRQLPARCLCGRDREGGRAHDLSAGRFDRLRSAAGALHQLGADAHSLLQTHGRRRQPRRVRAKATVHRWAAGGSTRLRA